MTPFGQRSVSVLFEDVSAVEMALVVEVIVDGGVDESEFLQGLDVSEPRNRLFSSSEGLMGVFGSIVEPLTANLKTRDSYIFHRSPV